MKTLRAIRDLAEEHGVLRIADEALTGRWTCVGLAEFAVIAMWLGGQ